MHTISPTKTLTTKLVVTTFTAKGTFTNAFINRQTDTGNSA